MIQINPLKSYIDGGVRAALTTPPSASLVFDLPGKAIWVKGVKLKGTDHTYTFSHDNYITLTNTPDSNESEDIKIGVNTSALKSAIDTTYGVVSTTTNGLAPKFTSGNKLAASAATTYYFLGWAGSTLKWYQAPFRNIRINSETTDCLGVNNTDPLIISSGNGISVTWDSTNKKIIITNTKPDVNHNTDTKVALSVTTLNKNYAVILKGNDSDEGSITTVNFSTYLKFNPYTKQLISSGEYYANGNLRLAHISEIPNSLKNPYSLTTFGVVYDGSATKVVSPSNFISLLEEGTSIVTDGTMFITSWASNSGFADTNAVNVPYKRKASHLWDYIKVKTDSLYAVIGHNHDGRYVRYYAVTTLDCNNLAIGLTAAKISATNAAHTNHSAYLYISDVGTPFQIQIPDSGVPYIYKRYYSSGTWSGWFKLNAGYADSAGSIAWNNITGKPSSYIPSAHTHTVFNNNLMIKGTNGISDSASIHLGIGDSDTGFKWISDGKCLIYANNVAVGEWTSGGINWFKNPTVNGNKVWNAGNDGSGSGLDADTVDGEHASNFSYTHQTSFDFSKSKSGRIVTFDQLDTNYGWINGFTSTHNNYLTSILFNTHRTSNWYVGYIEGDISTGKTNGLLAVRKLAFVDLIPTSLKNPHALTISLNGTSLGPYDGSAAKNINITPSSIGAATSGHNHDSSYVKYAKVTKSTADSANAKPYIYNIENEAVISGYYNYWYILNLGQYSKGNFGTLIAMPYQDNLTDSELFIRSANNGSWRTWRRVLHSNNYAAILDSRYYTRTDSDNRFVNVTGDIMTGPLQLNGSPSQSNPSLQINYTSNFEPSDLTIGLLKFGKLTTHDMYLGISPTTRTHFGRVGYFMHINSGCEFTWASSGWTNLMALTGGTGNLWVKGSVTASSFIGNASSATALTTNAGNSINPVYFSGGKPVACTMSTGKDAGILRSFGRGVYTSANQYFGNGTIVTIDPTGTGCISANDTILSLGDRANRNTQLLVTYNTDGVYYRRIIDNLNYGSWKRLAFTTDNVASATKLQTAKLLWGQSFDGTRDISGSISGTYFHIEDRASNPYFQFIDSSNQIGYFQLLPQNKGVAIGSTESKSLIVNSSGNVGIGTANPSSKLTVNGVGDDKLPVQLINASRDSTWIYNASFLAPNLTSNHNNAIFIGKAHSIRNAFGLTHMNIGDGSSSNYAALEIWGVGNSLRWYYDRHSAFLHRTDFASLDSNVSYMSSALLIREHAYGGAQADSWANAPRLSWHWEGRVQTQIGLASNNELYLSKNNFGNAYKLVYETGTWGINISGNASSASNADTVDGAHLSDIKNWSDRTASVYWKTGWYKVASAQTATNVEAFLTLDVNAAQSNGHATLFIRKRADSKPYFICIHNNNLNLADFRLYYNGMSMALYARVPNDWNGRVFRIISEGREGRYDHIWTLYSNISSTDPNAISAEGGNPYINPTYSGRVDWSNSSDKATRLQTSRTLWGQSFDGTTNIDNTLRIRQTTGNYCEGIRIQTADGAWSTIILGATADSGTNTNAWSIHRKDDNNFSISRNSSDGINGLVMTSVGMGLGTTAPTHRLDVRGDTRITGSIRDLAIGGGIYWNSYVESTTDGSDSASITVVRSGITGGTTLVLSLMNDTNDTILFLTSTAARLYHNSYPILTTLNTYVSNNKGYINGAEITYVNNAYTAYSASKLDSTGYANQGLSYYQTDGDFDGSTGWAHYIIANHHDGASYYHYTIRLPFWSVPQYRRLTGNTSNVTSWYNFITAENIGSQSVNYANSAGNADTLDGLHANAFATASHSHPYLPLSGGTMTGVITSTYGSGTWINGVTNAVIKGTYTGYGAILSMPVKDGRVSISSYPLNDNYIYFGYATTSQINAGTNSFNKKMYWDAANNNLHADIFTGSLVGNASTATNATNADKVDGLHFNWNNNKNDHKYLWAATDNGNAYLVNRASISVNYANSSNYANSADRANYLSGHNVSPNNSHPGHGARVFYSWNIGQVGNDTAGYSNGITIGSNPGDTNYGFQIVQNMWDDRTYTRRYNGGWQSWKTLAWTSDIPTKSSWNYDDVYSKLGHTHDDRYYTESEINSKLGAYLPLSGGTMTGALNFKNGTWNLMGDDAYIGDCNVGGMIGVKGANAATPGFALYNNSGTLLGKLYASGSTLIWSGGTIQATTFNGNATTASKWTAARTITLSGSVTGNVSIDGSGNVTLATTTNHTHNWANIEGKPNTFTPSSHTHDDRYYTESEVNNLLSNKLNTSNFNWTNLSGKLVAGNEFNIVNDGFNSSIWFNHSPINDRSKTASINGYHFGNGAGGYTSIKASGFIKNGSNSNYVLLGDGGHKAISDFATSGHTHTLTLASDTGSSSIALVHGGKYKLTAGGSSIIFTLPTDNDTNPANYYWANVKVSATSSTTTSPTFNTCYTNSWFRSYGKTGWYNETYYGGWYMSDTTWIRTHNSKGIYTDTGTIYNLGNVWLAYNSDSKVGIGTISPSSKLHVVGDSRITGSLYANYLHATNTVYAEDVNANSAVYTSDIYTYDIDVDNNVTASGFVYATHFYENSDIRYKKILRNLSINSNTIANLPLFDFEWIENNAIGTGTSALAVQQILPNLVSGTDKLTLDYGVLGTIAGITACKELVTLKSELLQLKEKVKLLEDKLRKYENTL